MCQSHAWTLNISGVCGCPRASVASLISVSSASGISPFSWNVPCFSPFPSYFLTKVVFLAYRAPVGDSTTTLFPVLLMILCGVALNVVENCLVSRVGYSVTDTDYCALLCVSAYSLLLAFCSVSRSHRLLTDPCTLQSVQVAFLSSFGWKAIQPGFYLLLDGRCFCRLSHSFSVFFPNPVNIILYYAYKCNTSALYQLKRFSSSLTTTCAYTSACYLDIFLNP